MEKKLFHSVIFCVTQMKTASDQREIDVLVRKYNGLEFNKSELLTLYYL
mgnify:CR=1 FL=1